MKGKSDDQIFDLYKNYVLIMRKFYKSACTKLIKYWTKHSLLFIIWTEPSRAMVLTDTPYSCLLLYSVDGLTLLPVFELRFLPT